MSPPVHIILVHLRPAGDQGDREGVMNYNWILVLNTIQNSRHWCGSHDSSGLSWGRFSGAHWCWNDWQHTHDVDGSGSLTFNFLSHKGVYTHILPVLWFYRVGYSRCTMMYPVSTYSITGVRIHCSSVSLMLVLTPLSISSQPLCQYRKYSGFHCTSRSRRWERNFDV